MRMYIFAACAVILLFVHTDACINPSIDPSPPSWTSFDVTICDGVTEIPDNYFSTIYHVSQPSSIVLPDSLESIGSNAFYKTSLSSIFIPANVTTIGSRAFAYTDLMNITFSKNSKLISIGDEAFRSIGDFNSISYDPTVTPRIYFGQAYTNYFGIVLPDSLENIGFRAFYGIAQLNELHLGSGVKNIGAEAFSGSGRYIRRPSATLKIPSSVLQIGANAFKDHSIHYGKLEINMQHIPGGKVFQGMYFDVLHIHGTETIGENAFSSPAIDEPKYIIIGESVTNIYKDAFDGYRPEWFVFHGAPTIEYQESEYWPGRFYMPYLRDHYTSFIFLKPFCENGQTNDCWVTHSFPNGEKIKKHNNGIWSHTYTTGETHMVPFGNTLTESPIYTYREYSNFSNMIEQVVTTRNVGGSQVRCLFGLQAFCTSTEATRDAYNSLGSICT